MLTLESVGTAVGSKSSQQFGSIGMHTRPAEKKGSKMQELYVKELQTRKMHFR